MTNVVLLPVLMLLWWQRARIRRMWSRTPAAARVVVVVVLVVDVVQAIAWNFVYNVAAGQQYDAPGTWLEEYGAPWDGIGETVENSLLMLALGVVVGLPVGFALRWRAARAH